MDQLSQFAKNADTTLSLKPNQAKVFDCPARFRILVAGRRFGKTYLALAEIMRLAVQPKRAIWYIGPNDGQSKRIVWERLKSLTRPLWAKRPNETELRIDLHSGTRITVSGAFNPAALRRTAQPDAWTRFGDFHPRQQPQGCQRGGVLAGQTNDPRQAHATLAFMLSKTATVPPRV